MSGASRSDPAYGSDGCNDFENQWAGKNMMMKWKVLGERIVLAAFTSLQKDVVQELPDGTIKNKIPVTKVGYETPGWKGATWASTTATFVPRSVWIIEGAHKDPYYNNGKSIFYVDKETYTIWHQEVFNRALEYWKWLSQFLHYGEAPSGNNTVGYWECQQAIDDRVHHASFARFLEHPTYNTIYNSTDRLGPSFFTVSKMLQISK